MSNEEIVPIQVTVPGADPAADALLRVGAAAGKLDAAVGAAKPKIEGADASLRKIAESSKNSEQLLKNLSSTGNAAFQALTEKAGQFAKTVGDSAVKGLGDFAEVGVKSLAAFGPWGIAATAAIGVVGIAVNTYREYEAQLARTRAISESTAAATAALGGSYSSVTAAANAATSAEAARVAVAREMQTILQGQLALVGEGYSVGQSEALTASLQRLSDATRVAGTSTNALSLAQLQHAVVSGNAAEQQRVLGLVLIRSTDAVTQHAQAVQLSAQAEATTARLRLEHARSGARAAGEAYEAERRRSTADESSLGTLQRLRPASAAVATARRELTAATAEAEARERALAAATQATAVANAEANETGKALARQRLDDNAADRRHARQVAAAAGAPSAQEQRAAIEALRVAREANDNATATTSATERQAQALRALAFAQNEVRIAEIALRTGSATVTERTALTAALNAQTAAQERLNAVGEAESAAARARIALLDREREARIELDAAAEAAMARDRTAQADAQSAEKQAEEEKRGGLAATREAIERIKTERMDALRDSAKGLAGGLLEAGIAAAIAGENIGAAMQKQLAAGLAALSAESAQRSLFSLGSALFQVGMGRLDLAGPLFVSAATFAAVAAGSGLAAAALTPSTPAAAGGGGSGGSSAANVSPPSQQSGEGGTVINVNFGGPVIGAGGARQVGRYLAEQINAAHRQGGVTLAPGLLRTGTR